MFVVGISALVALTGCGGGKAKDDGVASINDPSGSGASAKASADTDSGRPQLRVDTSDEEATRLFAVWTACLHDKGVPGAHKPGAGNTWFIDGPATKYPAQYKACLSKQPLQPPEEDPDKNPHYVDDFRAWVKCMNDKGMKVHMIPDHSAGRDAFSWTYNEGYVPTVSEAEGYKIQDDCKRKAFSGDN
ncbi:hypothetical protein [Streptomyces sp. NPDC005538]|uniref:hypothetical protein n=1 Tax=unclassified Streptomyces TaxID=2593676 RepID=UPI0033AA703D